MAFIFGSLLHVHEHLSGDLFWFESLVCAEGLDLYSVLFSLHYCHRQLPLEIPELFLGSVEGCPTCANHSFDVVNPIDAAAIVSSWLTSHNWSAYSVTVGDPGWGRV